MFAEMLIEADQIPIRFTNRKYCLRGLFVLLFMRTVHKHCSYSFYYTSIFGILGSVLHQFGVRAYVLHHISLAALFPSAIIIIADFNDNIYPTAAPN